MKYYFPQLQIGVLIVTALYACDPQANSDVDHTTLFELMDAEYTAIDFRNEVQQTRNNNHIVNVEFISGGGVALGDVNNDGMLDIFFTGNQVRDRLYLNKGNFQFSDISESAGISQDTLWSSGVTFADVDFDGDQDIYVSRNVYLEDENSANQLYINNGDLTFTESAASYGLDDHGFSIQSIFFDYDNDGLVDMYLVNLPPSLPGVGGQLDKSMAVNRLFSDKLFRNLGNNKFEDVTDAAQLRNFAFGLSASVGDFNHDGWMDIYVPNDFNEPDHLYMNQQDGTFEDKIHDLVNHISNFSMGSDVADYDNDGHLDILVVDMVAEDHKRIKTHMGAMKPDDFWDQVRSGGHYQYMFNTLQRNTGNGSFSDLAQLAGVSNTDWSWAPLFADLDNDGYKDIFVTNGVKNNNRFSDLQDIYDAKLDSINRIAHQKGVSSRDLIDLMEFVELAPSDYLANYVFKNNGDLTFTKMIKEWGFELPTLSNGAAYGDLDADGDLDLVINNIDQEAMLYKNQTMEQGLGNFIRIRLSGIDHKNIYGSKVTLYQNEEFWQMVQISNARGYMSKSEEIVHFGLGREQVVDKMIVQWPDETVTELTNLQANQIIAVHQGDASINIPMTKNEIEEQLFVNVTDVLDLSKSLHHENEFDDYIREVLLPHKMSEFGPPLGVGDVNGDKLQDFFVGGSAGYSGTLYMQNNLGNFDPITSGAWSQDLACEDMDAAFFDVDLDDDLDLFIVSGGNEFAETSESLQDRLYINDGSGAFVKSAEALPRYLSSGSCVAPADFDLDGDIDLFVGGRLIPGRYPVPASSQLLENRNGKFVDVTMKKAPQFIDLGLVTAASWTDQNRDGREDLVIVGEWMPVTLFTQDDDGRFSRKRIKDFDTSNGWYYAVTAEDMDGDGDEDLVVGNLGLNYKYKATPFEPFEIFSDDFDDNGSLDIVLSYYEHGEIYPVRGKDCSSQQIPSLTAKFPTYEDFGSANLQDIYGPSLEGALNLKAHSFASTYIENLGGGAYRNDPLPNLAQISSINNILIRDFDLDGNSDLLLSGNLFQSEIETPRNDAGYGLFLKGDGRGNFDPVGLNQSGFHAPFDAKDMAEIRLKDNRTIIIIANNKQHLQTIEYKAPKSAL